MKPERDNYGMAKHWSWVPIPWVNGWSPKLAQLFEDDVVLGPRVANGYDEESIWGADGIILFMAAPGWPWEGK